MPMRVKILTPQSGPAFFADAGEERTVHDDHGAKLLAAGHAALIAKTWPVKAAKAKAAPAPKSAPKPRVRKR